MLSSLAILFLGSSSFASSRLSGAGASYSSKISTLWFSDLAKEGGPRVNYQAVASGSGRKAFIDELLILVNLMIPCHEWYSKVTRGLVQIPVVGGTIAFGYNYNCELRLTQELAVLVAIGEITDGKTLLFCRKTNLLTSIWWLRYNNGFHKFYVSFF